MKFDINGLKVNVEIPSEVDQNKKFLILLHGFTGCAEDWLPVIEQMPINIIMLRLISLDTERVMHQIIVHFILLSHWCSN